VSVDRDLPDEVEREWRARSTEDSSLLRAEAAGRIYLQPISAQPISATAIRQVLRLGVGAGPALAGLLPAAVLAYIESNELYRH
jgi:nicotinic acid mononucleotide adenylyltransferase